MSPLSASPRYALFRAISLATALSLVSACTPGTVDDTGANEGAVTSGVPTTPDEYLAEAIKMAKLRRGGTVCDTYTGIILESLYIGLNESRKTHAEGAFRKRVREEKILNSVLEHNALFYEILGDLTIERNKDQIVHTNITQVAQHGLQFDDRNETSVTLWGEKANGWKGQEDMYLRKATVKDEGTGGDQGIDMDATWWVDGGEQGPQTSITVRIETSNKGWTTGQPAQTFRLTDESNRAKDKKGDTVGNSLGLSGLKSSIESSDKPCR